ncbi:hypothetical protein AH02_57 [Pseudomonas phage AH02]|nr:hypothetical protein AH02_57 [Pseudomonas phage AH02]
MSWPSFHRLCRHCGGVTISKRNYVSGARLRSIDKCDFCQARLTDADNYDGIKLPESHRKGDKS